MNHFTLSVAFLFSLAASALVGCATLPEDGTENDDIYRDCASCTHGLSVDITLTERPASDPEVVVFTIDAEPAPQQPVTYQRSVPSQDGQFPWNARASWTWSQLDEAPAEVTLSLATPDGTRLWEETLAPSYEEEPEECDTGVTCDVAEVVRTLDLGTDR